MPMIVFTPGEVFGNALDVARKLTAEILKLSDLDAAPLTPGESPDARRHVLAKLGKRLAEAFGLIDQMATEYEAHMKSQLGSDVTANAPKTEPDSNSN